VAFSYIDADPEQAARTRHHKVGGWKKPALSGIECVFILSPPGGDGALDCWSAELDLREASGVFLAAHSTRMTSISDEGRCAMRTPPSSSMSVPHIGFMREEVGRAAFTARGDVVMHTSVRCFGDDVVSTKFIGGYLADFVEMDADGAAIVVDCEGLANKVRYRSASEPISMITATSLGSRCLASSSVNSSP
jgi:hypothetical protein